MPNIVSCMKLWTFLGLSHEPHLGSDQSFMHETIFYIGFLNYFLEQNLDWEWSEPKWGSWESPKKVQSFMHDLLLNAGSEASQWNKSREGRDEKETSLKKWESKEEGYNQTASEEDIICRRRHKEENKEAAEEHITMKIHVKLSSQEKPSTGCIQWIFITGVAGEPRPPRDQGALLGTLGCQNAVWFHKNCS